MADQTKSIFRRMFSDRTVGFWLGCVIAVLGIAFSIYYVIADYGDQTFSMPAFICMLLGGVSWIAVIFVDLHIVALVPVVLFSFGTGLHIYKAAPTVTDMINNLIFFGGNQTAAILFTALFAACAVISIIVCFLKLRKKQN